MEINELVERKVISNKPLTMEYEIAPYGYTLKNLINEIGACEGGGRTFFKAYSCLQQL